MPIQHEVERVLTLLRSKIRERGFTQLQVQRKLEWGKSYISQLLTRQKALRVEQVLAILETIGVEPADFYRELYQFPPLPTSLSNVDEYPETDEAVEAAAAGENLSEGFLEVRALLMAVVQLLIDKNVLTVDEITSEVSSNGGMTEIG